MSDGKGAPHWESGKLPATTVCSWPELPDQGKHRQLSLEMT
jgi:hypothetical protein